ncbi:glutamine--fructose-6-phosphate transaminase (isomerizing) [Fontisphaera persica]|uniref:glutamine--fructose-6-phosphate transaminase (isomerizing) n=1 Tax=Fontisphaera persica TaxID=2974023 RepID=UPI0024C0565E|nr:glutamine--fructose-6-phosphate transaminase (isomerizing) [Fontisphaera persica]WCJ61242.1 glutamine--fructose-6-phosphate transaminase (isomerizing) [Fontisphaera persica]
MCGIIGYVGFKEAAPVLLDGLRRLEYRGYDSAGLAVLGEQLEIRKKAGKIDEGLARLVQTAPPQGSNGIGHTRWATHGPPTDANSHPHTDASGRIVVVHNGVIENYALLKNRLQLAGHKFLSETDTEVLAHLIGWHYQARRGSSGDLHPLAQAVADALREVIGTYGIAVLCADHPGLIVGARRGSPLIVGLGQGEHFLASDSAALVAHTRDVIYLQDHDLVLLTPQRHEVHRLQGEASRVEISRLEFDTAAAERGAFPHFMLKEIFEQPQTVRNALRGRLDPEEATARFGGLNLSPGELREFDQVVMLACGTSWHAALLGEYLMEELAHLPVEVEYASEFRYRNAPINKHTLVLAITQSGETADTLAGLREARRRGHKVLSICNVVGSTIAREADGGIYLHAGPEIGVAATKTFTAQVTVLTLLAVLLGRMRMLGAAHARRLLAALEAIPAQMQTVLQLREQVRRIAHRFAQAEDFFFLGRQFNFPVALEGALKLKEISYIHAEGYPAAEMKHGPIAMIDERTPTVILAPHDSLYEKTVANLEEIKARRGPIIAIGTEGDTTLAQKADEVLLLPRAPECLWPLLAVLPLQLLAYDIAVARGCDVDKPRNLAKSVTVE